MPIEEHGPQRIRCNQQIIARVGGLDYAGFTTYFRECSVVPAGVGINLPVNVTAGRFKHSVSLENWFSYDNPMESLVIPLSTWISHSSDFTESEVRT